MQPGRVDRLERLVRAASQRADPGRDLAVVDWAELPEHFRGHPDASHGSVRWIGRSHDSAIRGHQPGQLTGQASLAGPGVATEKGDVSLLVPAHPVPERFQIGHFLVPTQQRQLFAGLGRIGPSYGDGLPDLDGFPFSLENDCLSGA